jgi:drug/metabolite transporter (DMT)-like permease
VNPVVALCLGVTLGAEAVSPWEWLSAGVIMAGVVMLFAGRRPSRLTTGREEIR